MSAAEPEPCKHCEVRPGVTELAAISHRRPIRLERSMPLGLR
jgi:hypothetical protein